MKAFLYKAKGALALALAMQHAGFRGGSPFR